MNQENTTAQNSESADNSDAPASKPNNQENSTVESVKTTAKEVLDKAKDSAGQVYGIAAETATSAVNEQKSHLSGGLSGVADSIRRIGQDMRETDEKNPFVDLTAKYGDAAADQIERISGYFDEKELREIYRDVESFARRQPAVFIGAAFVVGFLAARFLRSGAGSSVQSRSKTGGNTNENASAAAINPS